MSDHHQDPDEIGFFEKPGTIRALWIILIALCVLFAGLGFVGAALHWMHPHYAVDAIPVFYALMGFGAFAFIVLAGQHLRKILMRDETYYDSAADQQVSYPRDNRDPKVEEIKHD